MPTYRRFTCVERSIACFLNQKTDLDTELIIMNTDVENTLELDDTFSDFEKNKIKIFNNNIDFQTNQPYNNTGSIRRDAFSYATGEYYITWDDDDIFLPWNIQQCYDGLQRTGVKAWKPYRSFTWMGGQDYPTIEGNYLEATVMLYSSEVTFNLTTGPENLSWFNRLKDENQLIEDEYSIPAYCFFWNDDKFVGGQKQSSFINEPNNFNMHMQTTIDVAKRKLTKKYFKDYQYIFSKFSFENLNPELVSKYVERDYYV
jgi:glycosyltransferase involved in cell wall biosynthesis